MHESARAATVHFYKDFCDNLPDGSIVLDFGSYSIDGDIRDVFEPRLNYVGIDHVPGPNVDIVCPTRTTPFESNYADVVISTSCFEHDKMFWMTFLEMCRVVKPGGYIYINAPFTGPYEAHPVDCWRFHRDAWVGLKMWALENGYPLKIIVSRIDSNEVGGWRDNMGVFKKLPAAT